MSRMRVTIRGEGTELRGYATMEALVSLTSPPGEQPYLVMASVADDNYNPFLEEYEKAREQEERELHHFETEQMLERVKALHSPVEVQHENMRLCSACITQTWPCATMFAIGVTDD